MYVAKIQKRLFFFALTLVALLTTLLVSAFFAPAPSAHAAVGPTPIKSNCSLPNGNLTNYKSPFSATGGLCVGIEHNMSDPGNVMNVYYQFAVKLPANASSVSVTGTVNISSGAPQSYKDEQLSFTTASAQSASFSVSTNSGLSAYTGTGAKCTQEHKGHYGYTINVSANGKSKKFTGNLCGYQSDTTTVIYGDASDLTAGDPTTGSLEGNLGVDRGEAAGDNQYDTYEMSGVIDIALYLNGKQIQHSKGPANWFSLSGGNLLIDNLKPTKAGETYRLTMKYNDCPAVDNLISDPTNPPGWVRDYEPAACSISHEWKNLVVKAGKTTWLTDPNGDVQYYDKNGAKTVYKPKAAGTNDITCGSEVAHLGWIVCPVIDALTNLDDYIWTLVSSMLTINPLNQSDSIYTAWASIRSIANVLFVVFFLIIIFSQLTGAGITNYGVKKMLPKIIIAAILVNISFVIIQLAVDLANIIGSSLYGFISGLAPPIVLGWGDLLRMVLGAAGTGAVGLAGIGLAAAAGFGGVGVIFWVIVPFVLMALLGLLTALLTLIFRQAAIPVLAILAPLAFVAYLLPNTEKWYKQWQKWLLSMLMMYPMAAVIFAGAQFAAATIIGNGGNFWNLLIGQVMLALPLFSLPFIAKQGGPILSGLNGALTKMSERARKPLTNWGNTRRDQAAADWMANGPRTRLGQRLDNSRIGGVIGRPRQIARNAAQRRKVREDRMEADKLNFQTEMDRSRTENMGRNVSKNPTPAAREAFEGTGPQAARPPRMLGGGALQSKDELAFAKKDADLAGVAATHRQDDTPWGRQLNKQIATGGLVHKTDEEGTAHRVAQSVEGQAAHQGLGLAQKQTKDDTIVIAHRLNTSAEGQALDQQIGVHEKQATLDTKATTRRLETSHAGIELDQQIGKAEYEEQIDKSNTQGRIDSDPELLEVRQEATASAEFAKGAKAQDQQFTAEASTEEGRAASIATLVAGGATALDAEGIVDELTTAQRSTDVASAGTAAAGRVQKTELRRAALEDGPRGAGTPSTTAVAMGGIDPHGTDRSIAGSIQEGDVEDAKHVDAASIRLTHADLERADVRELARGRPTSGPTGLTGADVETRIAAQKRTVATGDEEEIARQWDDMRDLTDVAGNPLPAEEADRIRTSFAESLMASKDKAAYYTPAQVEAMRTGQAYPDTMDLIGPAIDDGRYSGAESMATSTNDELAQIIRAAGIDPRTGLHIPGATPTLTAAQMAAMQATATAALADPRIDQRIKRTRQSVEMLSRLVYVAPLPVT